jgi:L-gulonolactone oxidase
MTGPFTKRHFTSWGGTCGGLHAVATPRNAEELPALLSHARADGKTVLPVGLGRSYGDSCINTGGALLDMTRLDRLIGFDDNTGLVRAEAGMSLHSLLRTAVPKGFFPTVVPGTEFVTLGGAVANDVHGKNHRVSGTFGAAVTRLGLVRSDTANQTLSARGGVPLFNATVAGLGLTGIIDWVELQMRPVGSAFLTVENRPFEDFDGFLALSDEDRQDWEYAVAWMDLASRGARGRGIYSRARFLDDGDYLTRQHGAGLRLPTAMPVRIVGSTIVKWINAAYHRAGKTRRSRRQHYTKFLFPLDKLGAWNGLYGPSGFYQIQCVVPRPAAGEVAREILKRTAAAGEPPFLVVAKAFGTHPSPGMLSFPREGITLALDFANRGTSTIALHGDLTALVRDVGGRLYPAKDALMGADSFRAAYPQWQEFAAHMDPACRSGFWKRVADADG